MALDKGKLLVSRKVLCLSSRVFQAMLGKSHFRQSSVSIVAGDGIQILSFGEDDFQTMQIVANIIHLQHDDVPCQISFKQLSQLATICDKYDLRRCLGFWPREWSKQYIEKVGAMGFEECLFIARTFRQTEMFSKVTKYLIANSKLSDTGGLLSL